MARTGSHFLRIDARESQARGFIQPTHPRVWDLGFGVQGFRGFRV